MKLISTDFSNLDKKTIYDFGDDEAIDVLLNDEKKIEMKSQENFLMKPSLWFVSNGCKI